jgi:hypothetical protein
MTDTRLELNLFLRRAQVHSLIGLAGKEVIELLPEIGVTVVAHAIECWRLSV